MLNITLICVGKMREKHYIAAFEEYEKRLGAFCRFSLAEVPEQRLPDRPAPKEIDAALSREADAILQQVPKGAALVAMCIEGKTMPSETLAERFLRWQNEGVSRLCFAVGGSFGLHPRVKQAAQLKLSMSPMTFPHHLARMMLMEQIYRAFTINAGTQYHK